MTLAVDRAHGREQTHDLHHQDLPASQRQQPGADATESDHREKQNGSAQPGRLSQQGGDRPGGRQRGDCGQSRVDALARPALHRPVATMSAPRAEMTFHAWATVMPKLTTHVLHPAAATMSASARVWSEVAPGRDWAKLALSRRIRSPIPSGWRRAAVSRSAASSWSVTTAITRPPVEVRGWAQRSTSSNCWPGPSWAMASDASTSSTSIGCVVWPSPAVSLLARWSM